VAKFEKLLVVGWFLISVVLLTCLLVFNWHNTSADGVIFADLLTNISKTGRPESHLAMMTQDFLFNKNNYLTINASELKKLDFEIPNYSETNFFKFHAYYILYLLSPFVWIFPANQVICFFIALSFSAMIVLLYSFLRSKNVNWLGSVLFCLLVVSHPVWNYGLQGQIYPDRLFLGLGVGLMWLLERETSKFRWLLLVGFLSSLIVEKISVMVGLVIVGYSFFYKKDIRYWILGIVIFLFGIGIIELFLNNSYYSSFMTISGVVSFPSLILSNQIIRDNLIIFLLVNLPLIFFGLFKPKLLLISLGVMLPNIVGSIGGAEKTGWLTHYHSIYFPILVWAAANGYTYLATKKKVLLTVIVILMIFGGYNVEGIKKSSLVLGKNLFLYTINKKGQYLFPENKLAMIVPEGSTVSLPEVFFVSLYRNRKLYYYPMGIDKVDYVVLNSNRRGFVSYFSEENASKADSILLERMSENGFDIDNPQPAGNALVFKRNQSFKIK